VPNFVFGFTFPFLAFRSLGRVIGVLFVVVLLLLGNCSIIGRTGDTDSGWGTGNGSTRPGRVSIGEG
jgi:hypothetical protein